MKLRSAQLVLLVLLFASLNVGEGPTLCLAGALMGQAAVSARTPGSHPASIVAVSIPASRRPAAAPASALASSHKVWTMRAPAAHAALLEATNGLPSRRL